MTRSGGGHYVAANIDDIDDDVSDGGPVALVMDQTCVDNTYKKEKKAVGAGGEGRMSDTNSAEIQKAGRQHEPRPNDACFAREPKDNAQARKGNTQKQGSFRIADNVKIADSEWEENTPVDQNEGTPMKRNRRRSSRPQGLRHEPDQDPDLIGVKFGRLEPLACKCVMQVMYGARFARWDLLRELNMLSCYLTKWINNCDLQIFEIM